MSQLLGEIAEETSSRHELDVLGATHQRPVTPVPNPAEKTRPRRDSIVSHVDVEFFDPTGVQELRRTLTEKSIQERTHRTHTRTSESTDTTLRVEEENFDFGRALRQVVKKWALIHFPHYFLLMSFPIRRDEASIQARELGVLFRSLKVVGLGASASFQPTLASIVSPKNLLTAIQEARHPAVRDILSGFEGLIRPGEMLCPSFFPGCTP